MALTPYRRGTDKERRIVNNAKKRGCTALRSAGSHSIIDVVVINPFTKEIKLIQSKLLKKLMSENARQKILDEGNQLNGTYQVQFELWD
jgi:Holliday junction resolvase